MNYLKIFGFILLSLAIFCSCQEDASNQDTRPEKELYFEDYESPDNKWGYIDTAGNIVIEKKYDDLRPFNDGLAIANYQGQWGFINKQGEAVIPHQYRAAFPFKDGIARIQNFDKQYGFIDLKGKMILPDTFDLIFDFNSERARAKKGENYGYIDPQGQWVIQPFYKKCGNFDQGYARVYQFGKAGLIDQSGAYAIPLEDGYDKIYKNVDGIYRLKKDKNYQFVSVKDFSKKSPIYEKATDFQDGIAAVQKDGQWMLIDQNFKKLHAFNADDVKKGGESKWIVKKNKKYGVMNNQGQDLALAEYDMIFSYSDEYAPYQFSEYWGYLDSEGNAVMRPAYPLAWGFKNGYARIINRGRIGYINKNLELAFEKGFLDAHDFSEGLAHIQ